MPYWRTDVNIADDVIEEIARIIGYDKLPTTQLRGRIPTPYRSRLLDLRERVRDLLADAGMQEVITYSMTDLETAGEGAAARRAGDEPAAAHLQPDEPRLRVRAHNAST